MEILSRKNGRNFAFLDGRGVRAYSKRINSVRKNLSSPAIAGYAKAGLSNGVNNE